MSAENSGEPEQITKCAANIVCAGGVTFQIVTPMTEEELYNELEANGGPSRTGYAKLIVTARPGNAKEVLRIWRQQIVGWLCTVQGERKATPLIAPSTKDILDINQGRNQ
jgi:hypothetical protein